VFLLVVMEKHDVETLFLSQNNILTVANPHQKMNQKTPKQEERAVFTVLNS